MFIDKTKVYVQAGNGGNGCHSFHMLQRMHKKASGGNGGGGGDIVFIANPDVHSLVDLRFAPRIIGENGSHGEGNERHGANGKIRYVNLPVGTIIRNIDEAYNIECDLNSPKQTYTVVFGGKGGFGNAHFMSNKNKIPHEVTLGEFGEIKNLELELKIIADVGLVGYPNAGKSSLLIALTDAHPKTAPYPFTTIKPIIGNKIFPDFSRLTIADIPGIIDGAHNNIGLGHDFLKHIERTKSLIYVIDMAGIDQREPFNDFCTLQKELELYDPKLLTYTSCIVANKMDEQSAIDNFKAFKKKVNLPVFAVSAILGDGIDKFSDYLCKNFAEIPSPEKEIKEDRQEQTNENINLSDFDDYL